MHIVFQFPIVDCRTISADRKGKLIHPQWPNPSGSSKHFIRHFGKIEERLSGGNTDWVGESHFCNAHLAMKYDKLQDKGYPINENSKSAIVNSYRRYFSDGQFVGRIEAAIIDNTEKILETKKDTNINANAILQHYANLQVVLKGKSKKLYNAGSELAKNYHIESTVKKDYRPEDKKYVVAGDISIVLVYKKCANLSLPAYAFSIEEIQLPENQGVLNLHGYKLRHEGETIKVWLIETPVGIAKLTKPAKEILRNLRINLMRIHLEKETIRIILNNIQNKTIVIEKDSAEFKIVNKYLKETAEKLFKKNRYKLSQQNILEFALHSENTVQPGVFSSLEKSILDFQDEYVRQNIETIIRRMAQKTILFICASPKGKNPLDFGREYMKIKEALRLSSDQNNYVIELEASVKKDEFLEILNLFRPDYLHLSMHASLTEGLYFENEDGEKHPMDTVEFATILASFCELHIPCVIILSACNSAQHAKAVKEYCEYAVGTQDVFPADAGIIYAAHFYEALFTNKPMDIPNCHELAKKAIQSTVPQFPVYGDLPSHEIPILITK